MFRRRTLATQIQVNVNGITIEVTRKPIKNLNLKVNARTGEVRVSSPMQVPKEGIVKFVRTKLPWIRKHLARKNEFEPKVIYSYESGEQHYFKGQAYELQVSEKKATPKVVLQDRQLKLYVRPGSDIPKREEVLNNWYRAYLKQEIPVLIKKWEPIMGVSVNEFGVKRMKTRWGTCAIRARRIWLNLELAKKEPDVLEYIVVHEMVHLLERLHSPRFHALMDQFMPDWPERDKKLVGTID